MSASDTAQTSAHGPVIAASNLTKKYKDFTAVDSISFEIEPGESFGFLGPNGAGKSTVMRMIGEVSTRTSGDLSVIGLDPDQFGPGIRSQLGVVPQEDNLDAELRVRDNLIVYGRYFGLPHSYLGPKADELLEFAQLTEKARSRVDDLSGGMKRRLTIARALINNPRIMMLDEATTGLDPQARHKGPGGQSIPYAAYIAPALLAVAAMNGAVFDSTWNVFEKMNLGKIYDGMLTTCLGPFDVALGEIMLALARGFVYACGFMIVMQVLGLNLSWTAILALPAVMLIAFGIASFGMGITSFMTKFQQMDWIDFIMLPRFLLSATFYPLSVFPDWMQVVIQVMPLSHGVELVRGLTTGIVTVGMLWHVLYYVVMILLGMTLTTRKLKSLFLD